MAAELPRQHAWCVSGTPISNRVRDLVGLLQFLEWQPLCQAVMWRSIVQVPYESRTEEGLALLHSVLRTIMWRHRKVHVQHEIVLPACTVKDVVCISVAVCARYGFRCWYCC